MKIFWLCFIPLFVAVDPLGAIPIYLGLTQELPKRDKSRVLNQSVLTALLVSLIFLIAGKEILRFLGIHLEDFQIAGGILLLVLAVTDLVHPSKAERQPNRSVGIVPIGIPLIMGPAALTTLMVLANQYPFWIVCYALFTNLVLMTTVLYASQFAEKIIGINGLQAFSKIVSLILAAIAVMFIRVGLTQILS